MVVDLPARALFDLRNKISLTLKTSFPSMIGNIAVSDDFLGKSVSSSAA